MPDRVGPGAVPPADSVPLIDSTPPAATPPSATTAPPAVSPEPRPFTHRMRVRYAECDAQGVVFNAHYLAYVDHALTELWRTAFGGYAQMTDRGVDVVVAESHLRFRGSARFDEEIDVAVSVAALGTTSMTLHDVVTRATDGVLLVEAEMRYVWVDVAMWVKTPVPGWARAGLAPFTPAPPVAPTPESPTAPAAPA